jgi:hypothetical protein
MRQKSLILAMVCALLAPAFVRAQQQTGSISGVVVDGKGSVVAGANVRITSDVMPGPRSAVTSELGLYTFLQLLPGTYSVQIEKSGLGTTTRSVIVAVARDTQLDVILGQQVSEAVTVTAKSPEVDLKSTTVSVNFTRDFFQELPLERSYLGMLQIVPGIAANGGFAPNAGGSRQDNVFLIDGVNITNPLFGYLSTEVNELDIAELSATRGAISAAAGRAQGFVSNAVTRSGTNRFAGSYRFEAIPNEWISSTDKQIRSSTDRWVNAFNFGGPIVQDRLFFYGSGRIFRSKSVQAANNLGAIPDRTDETDEWFGKITASLTDSMALNFGYRHRPTTIKNAGIGANDSPSVGTDTEGTNRVISANYDWFIGGRSTLTVKYVRMDEQTETVALTDLGFQPTPFDPNNLAAMGRVTVGGVVIGGAALKLNRQNYYRDEIKADFTQLFDLGSTKHQAKIGFGWDQGVEELTRESNGWGNISNVTVSGQPRIRANYYPTQPTQLSKGRTYSFYVQDDITLNSRIVVNLGVLMNRDEMIQDLPGISSGASTIQTGTFLTFPMTDQVQPRVGVNYMLRKDAGDKVYANYGRYYGLDQKSSARALASGRLYTEDADFHPVTGALISQTTAANTAAKNIERPIHSPYTDEWVIGYASPLADGWSFDAFWLYRDTDSFIEDIPTVLPNSTYVYRNDPIADRKYKTFTMELNRNLRDTWAMNISYAWSKLYGNYDQDYSGGLAGAAIFNTSSLINDGPGSFTADTFRQGVLSQDRPHVFKVLATWNPKWVPNFTTGATVRTQSGTPWEARGLPWGSSATYLRLLEPAGTNRNPTWTNVDLLLKYGIGLGGRRMLRFEGKVLNLFNNETVLLVDNRKYLNPRNLTVVGTPPTDCLSCWTDAFTAAQPTTQPNANFGLPTAYAPQRRFQLSVLFDF